MAAPQCQCQQQQHRPMGARARRCRRPLLVLVLLLLACAASPGAAQRESTMRCGAPPTVKRICFAHVPKTGGTALMQSLFEELDSVLTPVGHFCNCLQRREPLKVMLQPARPARAQPRLLTPTGSAQTMLHHAGDAVAEAAQSAVEQLLSPEADVARRRLPGGLGQGKRRARRLLPRHAHREQQQWPRQ